ncbi:hypothetical protein BDB00DRAFT_869005 [Zychaea mexicana]|uniref:uncharacterized protein n=1 Tax=Zychaea mexicana TaxID=64656 RepID=UPI0022FF0409|nr:uncharacterized protein BDB00DRAFT_869005 [Zychaea mexicana]KAI9496779.1 hypothetical protein BDB00DRAFT_869005 [Zychaea mexicana]
MTNKTTTTTLIPFLCCFILLMINSPLLLHAYELSGTGLCEVEGDSTGCAEACSMLEQGNNGICVYDNCYCTDVDLSSCNNEEDHEVCDSVCQDMGSNNLIGFCMDGQCSCLD